MANFQEEKQTNKQKAYDQRKGQSSNLCSVVLLITLQWWKLWSDRHFYCTDWAPEIWFEPYLVRWWICGVVPPISRQR